jgi:chemotaxis protein CheD
MFKNYFEKKLTNYYLYPGYIYLAGKPAIISTVLGSCVAVCLYDRKKKIGGMNHFQFPFADHQKQATGRYGNAAVVGLVQMLVDQQSKTKHIESQILGGADPGDPGILQTEKAGLLHG